MDGLITCARYAFMPNHLGYCGPEENENLFGYITQGTSDQGLKEILIDFETLKPYLTFIARTNRIPDVFNKQVVEAYWIGNSLLGNISIQSFYRYLNDDLMLTKKFNRKSLHYLFGKLSQGAKPHHSFHVLNIFKRTGHLSIDHTLKTMDNCRINWGKVIRKTAGQIIVNYRPLEIQERKLKIGDFIQKTIISGFKEESIVQKNDLVTFHWNAVCEKINNEKARWLDYYTQKAIDLANLTF